MKTLCLVLLSSFSALASDPGEEVELSSGAVTALSCAKKAQSTGNLDVLSSCPPSEAVKGLVIFDVAEKQIYKLSAKKVHAFELARAFNGGSIDFSGKVVVASDKQDQVPVVEVKEYSITPRPKPGNFKGCM